MSNFKFNVAVIGLGYVGLPLAIEAANNKLKVAGYDINESLVGNLNKSLSHVEDISDKDLEDAFSNQLLITSDPEILGDSEYIVISVPTPLTDYQPDLSYVEAATKSIAENLKKDQIIILESTTYPGTTLEIVKPILEKNTSLVAGEDFLLGYSPERIDPGNKEWTFKNTPKIVSGINEKSLKKISEFYNSIIDEVVEVSGTREAEMVKLIENTYRQVNIAMVNELAILSNMLDIDIWEVVDAAKTKPFGFQSFRPGPGVGGHCIPIDPKYLSFKTRQIGQPVRFVELAQEINNSMPNYVISRISELMNKKEILLKNSKILVLGVAYKKDIGDTRESPAIDIIESLLDKSVEVSFYDPFVDELIVNKESILKDENLENLSNYDLVIIHTPHTSFNNIDFENIKSLIFDTTGSFTIPNAERI
ncbi:MAG: nucleotide sugar dehydrogenase [Candidatus Actinomarina sp.]|tara:strand:- start:3546 stop:4808 length:1263 start_codon:yes stop_codon:yes gene_type:complete